jgi:PTS system cellobiose-specific IIC component
MSDAKSNILEKISRLSDIVGGNVYLQAVSQGGMAALPFIIIGAFSSLLVGLPIEGWKSFIGSIGLDTALTMLVNATTNFLGIYITFFIAHALAEKLEVNSKMASLLVVMVYLVLLPSNVMKNGTAFLAYDFLGTKGMVIGIIIGIASVKLYKTIIDKNITIKMPEGTPPFVSNTFVSLIPGVVLAIIAVIIRMIFSFTSFGDMFHFIYSILQLPLEQLVGNNVWSLVIVSCVANLLFALGIHPGFVMALIGPILIALDGANQAAYAAGKEIPNIIGMAFSYSTTIAVFYPAIALTIVIFAKSKQLKTVGKVAIAPSFFGISEPLVFGAPIVFNPFMIIPWVLVPIVNVFVAYFAISTGLVHRMIGAMVFNMPVGLTGILNGGISISILEIVLVIIDILLFLPFVKLTDKKYLDAEVSVQHTA